MPDKPYRITNAVHHVTIGVQNTSRGHVRRYDLHLYRRILRLKGAVVSDEELGDILGHSTLPVTVPVETMLRLVALDMCLHAPAALGARARELATRLRPQPRYQTHVTGVMHLRKADRRRNVLLIRHRIRLFALTLGHRGETHRTHHATGFAAGDVPMTITFTLHPGENELAT